MLSLLALAVSYDNRKPSEAHIAAWQEASVRGRWTYTEARDAILDHFANETAYLTPGHVTQRIKAARSSPPPMRQLEGPKTIPAAPERIREIISALARTLGWTNRTAEHPAMSIQCGHCGAAPHRPCARQLARGHRRGRWVAIRTIHDARITEWENT